jgi:uroporphyrinogen-III synthase
MRVLVTRPIDDALETAAHLAARGHQSVISPLLEIQLRADVVISLIDVQAILATSSNGVRALSQLSDRRDLPLFAVGEHTASIARDLDFSDVRSANGNVQALADAVWTWARPEAGALVHVAGSEKPGPLATSLHVLGYEVRTAMLYRAVPVARLTPAALDALRAGILDAVLLFSPNTAATFVDCVAVDGVQKCCRTLVAYCISSAAAAPLKPLELKDLRWPAHPDQAGVLSLLD